MISGHCMHIPGRRGNARSLSIRAEHQLRDPGGRTASGRDDPGAGAVADLLRRASGRGDLRRHDHDDRRIPRARAGQQRARAEECGPAAHPSLRRTIRGLRRHRGRCDRALTRFRHRFTCAVQVPGCKRRCRKSSGPRAARCLISGIFQFSTPTARSSTGQGRHRCLPSTFHPARTFWRSNPTHKRLRS